MTKLLAKLYYLEQLASTKDHHRRIANRLTERFDVSAAQIKDELLEDGYIKLDRLVPNVKSGKNHYFFVLTDKKFQEKSLSVNSFWDDGTRKSTGNAFDLSTAKGLFTRAELANSVNKGKPNNYNTTVQVIAYSRA